MKTAELLCTVFQWIGVFAAIITVISVIYDKKRWLTVIAAIIAAISAVITVATGHYLDNLRTKHEEAQANQLAEAKKDLEALRLRTQPRQLSVAQTQSLFTLLSQSPQGAIKFEFSAGDRESYRFAEQLTLILKTSGWTITGFGSVTEVGTEPVGLIFWVHSMDTIPAEAQTLKEFFDRVGLHAEWRARSVVPLGTFTLFVGHKPD